MQCFYCGKNIEDNGVERQGHTFCNNLCRYSFEKFGTSKSHTSIVAIKSDVTKKNKDVDPESLANNKYIKLIATIVVVVIGILIYKGISNYVENKQAFTVIWLCICLFGFIASVAATKRNDHHPQTNVDKKKVSNANFKSIFDNNYLKLVFAILTALLIYRSITNYIEYKQTEALIKDLDKTMIQFDRNMKKILNE